MRLPDSWYNEFETYCKEMFYGNDGIYDDFNATQINVIKSYFKWRSREKFKSLCKDTSLVVKPKKAETLAKVMENITDWTYDGCVDTGFFGGGQCELGHTLRYEHYALSPSTNKTIVFGSNCAADFFGIEPDRLRKINSVQDEVLREVKIIAFIVQTGKFAEYTQLFYPDLGEVLSVIGKECDKTFGYDWNHMMADFLKAGLPWTPSMVDRYKWVKRTFYEKMKLDLERQMTAQALFKGDAKDSKLFDKISTETQLHYIKTILAYIATKAKDDSDLQIRRNKALVRLGSQYVDAFNTLTKLGVSKHEEFCRKAKTSIPYIVAKNGKRIATVKEVSSGAPGIFFETETCLPDDKYQLLQIFGWGLRGNKTFYQNSECGAVDDYELDKLEKSAKKMDSALKWILSSTFKSDFDTINSHKTVDYAEHADDEVKSEETVEFMAKYIADHAASIKVDEWAVRAGNDIACRYLANPQYKLSPKQINVLRKAYTFIKTAKGEAKKTSVTSTDKHVIHAQALLDNKGNPALRNSACEFALKVALTVVAAGKATDRQAYHIENAYDLLDKSIREKENYARAMGDGTAMVLSIGKDGKVTQVPMGKTSKSSTYEDKSESTEEPQFLDSGDRRQVSKDSFVGGFGNLPSIVAMSDALGFGAYRKDDDIE